MSAGGLGAAVPGGRAAREAGTGCVSLVVAIPTYKRPDGLERAVRTVLPQMSAVVSDEAIPVVRAELLVIDNDPAAGARATAERLAAGSGGGTLRYVVEERPGVAAVRNRALDEAAGARLLVFIDDDEEALEGWLASLVELWAREGAQAVAGHVLPAYDAEPEAWVREGGFFVRATWPTGTARPAAASNCLLLDLDFLRARGLRFDERFGATGGEDTLLTRSLVAAGGTLLWCAQAQVVDHVPAQRLNRGWIMRRQRSHAANSVRVDLALAGEGNRAAHARIRGRALIGGAVRLVAGAGRAGAGVLLRSTAHRARGARLMARGAGLASAALGRSGHAEYGRS
ncbi:Glycosyl transferase family 2 [Actinomyces denticolens]|uniref:Glycosyl transferase family 2 n=1 Tax=Actinomyces denticolens TaxID=52767 RepID=A0ABY1IH69_9ACTO|nr:glycosyltransferase family 2 protein [Actinomyces denticolens]SHJ16679.1 Glycosyl transferase family 2 [Actinomyces denticolens]